jgi:hypothetical protein
VEAPPPPASPPFPPRLYSLSPALDANHATLLRSGDGLLLYRLLQLVAAPPPPASARRMAGLMSHLPPEGTGLGGIMGRGMGGFGGRAFGGMFGAPVPVPGPMPMPLPAAGPHGAAATAAAAGGHGHAHGALRGVQVEIQGPNGTTMQAFNVDLTHGHPHIFGSCYNIITTHITD